MARGTRFCLTWLLSALLLLLAVGVFNVIVDPYDVFGTPRIHGLNAFKSQAKSHTLLAKTHQVLRLHPRAVLIGASTADLGLDPDSPYWPASARPVFDFGTPGTLPDLQFRTLRDAVAAGPVQLALVVLDFDDALQPGGPAADGGSDNGGYFLVSRDGGPNHARLWQGIHQDFLSTLTLGALEDSLLTVATQYQRHPLDLTDHGATTEAAFQRDAAIDGYNELFVQKERDYARKYGILAQQHTIQLHWLETIRDMIAFSAAHHIRLIMVIAPCHADLLDLIQRAGLWPTFEAWKQGLTKLASSDRDGDVSLWDFTGYDQYSTEELSPPHPHGSAMKWFWEPVHFKRALGNLVLQRVLTGEPADFGVRLTPDDIVAHLADIRAEQTSYHLGGSSGLPRVTEIFSRMAFDRAAPQY